MQEEVQEDGQTKCVSIQGSNVLPTGTVIRNKLVSLFFSPLTMLSDIMATYLTMCI